VWLRPTTHSSSSSLTGIVVGQINLGNKQNNHGNLRTQHWDYVTGTHDDELGKD